MARKNSADTPKGKLYAIEWPEWHVECAHVDCDVSELAVGMGEAFTAKEARKVCKSNDCELPDGWKERDGFWYCPKHNNKAEQIEEIDRKPRRDE